MSESDYLNHHVSITQRPRRNRKSASVRNLVRETTVLASDLILPLFLIDGEAREIPVESMPGIKRMSVDRLVQTAAEAHELGIPAVALFPALDDRFKDRLASESRNPDGLLPRCVRELKNQIPELTIITDVAMDPYSSDGHDGIYENGSILNDPTLQILAEMAVCQAAAGADMVAPSDMMDGRIGFIRQALDENGFENASILAYSAKYASAFYGPFRDALDSAPKSGDKKTYQMDPANRREAIREIFLDIDEGADIVMVKPALPYLDVISEICRFVEIPLAAYNVSGEYAMVKAASRMGWLDGDSVMMEMLTSIKRAGADMILTYFALDAARKMA